MCWYPYIQPVDTKDWPKLNRWPHLSYIHSVRWALKFISLTNSLKCLVSLHFLPFHFVCLHEGFLSFPYLNSFHWLETLQTPQWFLCAKWTSVKRAAWNLSTPGDQIDLAAAKMKQIIHLSVAIPTPVPSTHSWLLKNEQITLFYNWSLGWLSVFITCGHQWLWDIINHAEITSLF